MLYRFNRRFDTAENGSNEFRDSTWKISRLHIKNKRMEKQFKAGGDFCWAFVAFLRKNLTLPAPVCWGPGGPLVQVKACLLLVMDHAYRKPCLKIPIAYSLQTCYGEKHVCQRIIPNCGTYDKMHVHIRRFSFCRSP